MAVFLRRTLTPCPSAFRERLGKRGGSSRQVIKHKLSHTPETPGHNIKQTLVDGKLFIRRHILKASRMAIRKWDVDQSIAHSANYKKEQNISMKEPLALIGQHR